MFASRRLAGRRDLFDVLNYRNPGVPSDDSWMGHAKVDPQRGKASCITPAERMGRMNLNHIMEQSILRDEDRDRLLAKGQDPLGDSWIGHKLIDPRRGKESTTKPAVDNLVDSGCNVGEHSEAAWETRHRKVPTGNTRADEAEVKDIIHGVAPPGWTPKDEWGPRTKREKPEWNHTGRGGMMETMRPGGLPPAAQDSGRPWQWDDSKVMRPPPALCVVGRSSAVAWAIPGLSHCRGSGNLRGKSHAPGWRVLHLLWGALLQKQGGQSATGPPCPTSQLCPGHSCTATWPRKESFVIPGKPVSREAAI